MFTYLENYLESISALPAELNRCFALVQKLDEKSQELLDNVQSTMSRCQSAEYGATNNALTDQKVQDLRKDLQTCSNLGDEKISLVTQAYDLIDAHIRRLDGDLTLFKEELEKQDPNALKNKDTIGLPTAPVNDPRRPFQAVLSEKSSASTTGRKKKKALEKHVLTSELEMPIDPNEPRYCLCNNVSSGEMVGCDNPECPIEWYHLECIELEAPIEGKWICPLCKENKS